MREVVTHQHRRRTRRSEHDPVLDVDNPRIPHNLEAEQAVLGAILIDPRQLDVAAELIHPRDFYRAAHELIFDVMLELHEEGAAVDLVSLKDRLAQSGDLEDAGGAAYLAGLTDGVPRASNLEHYCRIVKDKKALRGLLHYARVIVQQIQDGDESPAQLLEHADTALLDLQTGHSSGRLTELKDAIDARDGGLFQRLERRGESRGAVTGVPSGFPDLDDMTMGFQPGTLWVIAALPSVGKTTWAMNIATEAAKKGKRGAIFSLEMSRQELEDRLLASLSNVDHHRILSGFIGDPDYAKLSSALGVMHGLPLHIDDTPSLTAPAIRRRCRRMKSEKGLDFVIVDYLQLMPGVLDKRETDDKQIGDTCLRLKTMARELRVPVILLSQLNRESSKRGGDGKPHLQDLRGSGMIEAHADGVIFLWRKNHAVGGATEGIVRKHRNGPTGSIGLSLSRETLLFTPAEPPSDHTADVPKKTPVGVKRGKAGPKQQDLEPPPSHQPED